MSINLNADCLIQSVEQPSSEGSLQKQSSKCPLTSNQSSIESLASPECSLGFLSSMWNTICSFFSTASSAPEPAFYEQLSFDPKGFDNRIWKLDFFDQGANGMIMEYTLPQEAVNNWSELITVQLLQSSKPNLKEFCEVILVNIYNSYDADSQKGFNYTIYDLKSGDVICEWWNLMGNDPNYECFKLIQSSKDKMVYRFAYTTRKLNELESKREGLMTSIVRDISIEKIANLPSDAQPMIKGKQS